MTYSHNDMSTLWTYWYNVSKDAMKMDTYCERVHDMDMRPLTRGVQPTESSLMELIHD